MELSLRSLEAAAFAPFGDVIAPSGQGSAANAGMARRFDGVAALENRRPDARPNLAIFAVQPYALPFQVRELEQHPHSTQAFLPLDAARYAVVVCAAGADGAPDLATARAFVAGSGVGVCYRAGTWHHAIMALDRPARFASLIWEDGGPDDCVVRAVDGPLIVPPPE